MLGNFRSLIPGILETHTTVNDGDRQTGCVAEDQRLKHTQMKQQRELREQQARRGQMAQMGSVSGGAGTCPMILNP